MNDKLNDNLNNHSANQFRLEPLGEGFTADDLELDSRLSELLGNDCRAGLSDRVFQASVQLLTTPATIAAPPLRLAGTNRDRQVRRRRLVSRLAMAASVALVCVVGLKVSQPTAATSPAGSSENDWAMFESLDSGYGSVSRLLETDAMSMNDVTSELTMLVSSGKAGM